MTTANLPKPTAQSVLKTPRNSRARFVSLVMFTLCSTFTFVIMAILLLVLKYLIPKGFRALSLSFFSELPIPFGEAGFPGGMKNGIVGTIIMVSLAAIAGIPLGMLAGVYLSEYGANSRFSKSVRFVADVLSGVPSIVVGILGYELLVVRNRNFSGWAGAFALSFLMVPIIARTTEEMLRLVPQSYREGSIALGASKARTILKVVIPSATGSLITGVMLALARVAGETAPLLFTALGSRFLETNPSQPFPSLTKQIFDNATSSYDLQKQLAHAGILVLIGIIFVFNVAVRIIVSRKQTS